MKKILTTIAVPVSTVLFALAQTGPVVTTANNNVGGSLISLLNLAQTIVARLVPLFIGIAVVSLFYGIVMFLIKGRESDTEHTKYMKWMGYSILALFVMVSIWGLVAFIGTVFGVGQGGNIPTPGIPLPQ